MVFLAGRERRVLIKGFAGRYPRSRGDLLCECGVEWRGLSWGVEERRHRPRVVFAPCTCSGDCTQWVRVPRMRAASLVLHACTFLRVFTAYGCRAGIPIGDLHVAFPVIDEQKRRESGCENYESKKKKEKRKNTIRRKITSLATYVIFQDLRNVNSREKDSSSLFNL